MKNTPDIQPVFDKRSTFEIILISIILLASITALFWIKIVNANNDNRYKTANVYLNSNKIVSFDLSADKKASLLDQKLGIEIRDGRIRVSNSTCRKQLCVGTGWIENPGQVIVCVPNAVVIEIEGSTQPFLDAIVR